MALKYILVAMFVGTALAQTEHSLSDVMSSLPPELQGKIDEKQLEEAKNKSTEVLKEKCAKNGGPDAFPNAEKAFNGFKDCLMSLIDVNILKDEIENAKPNGQVDEVFKKYCDKKPKFKDCFRNMTEAVKPCFSEAERNNLKTVYNVSEQLADFICFKDGDRIALFISESGPECLQEKTEDIQACVNKTIGGDIHFDQNNFSAESLPIVQFGEKECGQLSTLQACVVAALETCRTPASANIVDSLFNFARKATPCRDVPNEANPRTQNNEKPEANSRPNSGQSIVVPSVMLAVFAAMLV